LLTHGDIGEQTYIDLSDARIWRNDDASFDVCLLVLDGKRMTELLFILFMGPLFLAAWIMSIAVVAMIAREMYDFFGE
jgi:hypothetical protein